MLLKQKNRRVSYSAKEVIDIWYLLYCPRQNERKILNSFKRNMSKAALKDAFIFTYDRMRKFQGKWRVEKQLMFPGYIFLESDNEEALTEEWQQYKGVANLLQEKNAILHVQKKEELFLTSLCKEARHLGMSKGVIRDGVTLITEGPLQGMEERICRIDRHKRLARLKPPEGSVSGSILAGLEIVEKN